MTQFINADQLFKSDTETKFTHELEATGWEECDCTNPKNFSRVTYLGHCAVDGDMFACYADNYISIFKGIKGLEFND